MARTGGPTNRMSSCSAQGSSACPPAIAARQRGLSVIARRPPRAGQRDVLRQCRHFQQRLDPAAQQALAVERAAELPRQHHCGAALESDLGDAQPRLGRAVSRQCVPSRTQAARDRAAWPDRRVAETAPRMDREGECRQSHPRDRLAEGLAQRCRSRPPRQEQALLDRIRHPEPAARPSGDLGARAEHPAGLQGRPPAHADRFGRFAGRGGQGLCADAGRAPVARSASPRSSRLRRKATAGASCSPMADLARAMSWSRWARGRPICCGRSAIACRWRSSAATIGNSRRIRHAQLQRPIHDAEGSFLMTPMENGIRVTSGVELTERDAPSSLSPARCGGADGAQRGRIRLSRRRALARRAADAARQSADDWSGAAASGPLARLRQPAYRLHHRPRDGRGDRRDDRRSTATL